MKSHYLLEHFSVIIFFTIGIETAFDHANGFIDLIFCDRHRVSVAIEFLLDADGESRAATDIDTHFQIFIWRINGERAQGDDADEKYGSDISFPCFDLRSEIPKEQPQETESDEEDDERIVKKSDGKHGISLRY